MPITKRAIKKLRHDRRRSLESAKIRASLQTLIKAARRRPTGKTLPAAFSALDKAANHHLIHSNKAARLKARLAKLLKAK